jgi:peroxiredoxin
MSHLAVSPAVLGMSGRLGLWGVATYGVLRLEGLSIGPEHSVCGPWGCGPTIPSLAAAHGFWLMVILPAAFWAGRRLPAGRRVATGWVLIGLGLGGLAALVVGDLATWLTTVGPELRPYAVRRALFVAATLVEVPLAPMALAGLILVQSARRSRSVDRGAAEECPDGSCDLPAPVDRGRLAVGSRMPTLGLVDRDGRPLSVPDLTGSRPMVLYFMRAASCSICLGHVRELSHLSPAIRSMGADVLVVHPGTEEGSRKLFDALDLPIAIVSGAEAYEQIGLGSWVFGAIRGSGSIVVDPEGVIRYARRAVLPSGAFDRVELLEAVRATTEARSIPGA